MGVAARRPPASTDLVTAVSMRSSNDTSGTITSVAKFAAEVPLGHGAGYSTLKQPSMTAPLAAAGKGSAVARRRIAVLGKGRVGEAMGHLLMRTGFHVKFGSHSAEKLLASLPAAAAASPEGADGETVSMAEAAAWADIAILAVPGSAAVEVTEALFKDASAPSKVLVDLTNPVAWKDGPYYLPPMEGSNPQAMVARVPQLRVVKGFNNLALEQFLDPSFSGMAAECTVCADDVEAKALTMELARELGFQPVDVGGIRDSAESEKRAIDKWFEFRKARIAHTAAAQAASLKRALPTSGSAEDAEDSLSRLDSVDTQQAKLIKHLGL